jgi:hypothetical protein
MKISDIARIKVDWMERFGNDPHLEFILKRDAVLTPWEQFRFRQFRNLFVAEHEGEVRFVAHDRNDHNGFGGAVYNLHMADDWDSTQFRPCHRTEPRWNSGGGSMEARCQFDSTTRILTLTGPWSGGASGVSRLFRPVVSLSVLEGRHRNAIRDPKWYHRARKRGHAFDGTAYATACTLEFVQEALDVHAPHLELYEGDFGWYVKRKGDAPKNPRRRTGPVGGIGMLSDEQMSAVFA